MFGFSKNIKIKKSLNNSLIYKYKLSNDKLFINKILEIPPEFCGIVSINNKYIDEVAGEIKINSVNLPNIFKKISENNNNNKKYFKCDLYLINKNKFEKDLSTYKYVRLGAEKVKLFFNLKMQVISFTKFYKFYKKFFYGNNDINFIIELIAEDLTYYLDKNNICLEDIINNEKNYQKIINKITKSANKLMGMDISLKYTSNKIKKLKNNKNKVKENNLSDEKTHNETNTFSQETLITSPFYKENLKDTKNFLKNDCKNLNYVDNKEVVKQNFCNNCGNKINYNDKFCSNCGNKIS